MMYTELFCFEGAAATDAAPRLKAARRKRNMSASDLPQSRESRRQGVFVKKEAMMTVRGRRAAHLR